ncbi:MgtC family protein [Klebsiella pasteurii]|uniref:Protein MgtC n=1 Tax=Klebsiella pasteurii TaxID=2587529 RepID=A0ABD5H7Q5_9ENTR|nr:MULTISPECIES: MgtC family protein [Klebsiella]MBF8461334.1 MgtC family protein [Klebsiella michiganensis]MBG2718447.1 MgtC family protein [Klebsiella michiganensis]MBZ7661628.1 MgtC family protein [Klebsiella grimontii]MDC0692637.1 MgtC family protein [Klebsiella pasteurii]MDC0755651.1 MgtC family protein [Klebsiella pasteurii]
MEEAMLMFPYIANLLAAMLLGALIGAERQWRQRMAGLRTNALVATGAAVFILSSISTSPDSPGRIAAQVVSGIGFLGAGVIMREGMNVRGLNTAATLWCSAAIGVLCGLGQFWQAAVATLIILCANILLREAAQRINQIPGATEEEKCYVLNIICHSEHENAIRQLLLNISKEMTLSLQGLVSIAAKEQGHKEIRIELVGNTDHRKVRDLIMARIGGDENITSVRWCVEGS